MTSKHLPQQSPQSQESFELQIAIEAITQEIYSLSDQISDFEAILRLHLTDYIVETHELTSLYKSQKKAKKDKRLAQKQRGKNYKAPKGLTKTQAATEKTSDGDAEALQLKKRLYREAMLQVHPDKFSLHPAEQESANNLTTQLITIYKTGTLEELKAFHTHLFTDQTQIKIPEATKQATELTTDSLAYLRTTLAKLELELKTLKNNQLYKILTTYPKPLVFVDELKAYYKDKIEKLKKRTRTKS